MRTQGRKTTVILRPNYKTWAQKIIYQRRNKRSTIKRLPLAARLVLEIRHGVFSLHLSVGFHNLLARGVADFKHAFLCDRPNSCCHYVRRSR